MHPQLLGELAAMRLPTTFTDKDTVELIWQLRETGYVAAISSSRRSPTAFASVLCITATGRSALERITAGDQHEPA